MAGGTTAHLPPHGHGLRCGATPAPLPNPPVSPGYKGRESANLPLPQTKAGAAALSRWGRPRRLPPPCPGAPPSSSCR